MCLLKPNSIFIISGGKDGLVSKLFLLGHDASDLQWLVFRMLYPMSQKGSKEILAHVVRSMLMKGVQHVEKILGHPCRLGLMHNVDPNLHLVPICY